MAGKKIGKDDIFDPDLLQYLEALSVGLKKVVSDGNNAIEALKATSSGLNFKNTDDLKSLVTLSKQFSDLTKNTADAQKAQLSVEKELEKVKQEKIKTLKSETQEQNRTNKATQEAALAQQGANGAYKDAVSRLNDLKKILKDQALNTTLSANELSKLRTEFAKLDKDVRATEQGVGEFQRSVGNYEKGFSKVTELLSKLPGFDKLNDAAKGLRDVGKGAIDAASASTEAAESTGLFGSILGSLGVLTGVVTGGLAVMATAFLRTTDGVKFANVALKSTTGFIDGLIAAANPFSEKYGEFITTAIDVAKAGAELARIQNEQRPILRQLIKDQGNYNYALAISNDIANDATKSFKDRAENLKAFSDSRKQLFENQSQQVNLAIKEQEAYINSLKKGGQATGNAFKDLFELQNKLRDIQASEQVAAQDDIRKNIQLQIQQIQNTAAPEIAKVQGKINNLLALAGNDSKGIEERKAAAKSAAELSEQLESKQIGLLQRELAILKDRDSASQETLAKEAEINTKLAEQQRLIEENARRRIDLEIQDFKFRSDAIQGQKNAEKSLLEEEIKNQLISFDRKVELTNRLGVLNEQQIDQEQKALQEALKDEPGLDLSKLDFRKLAILPLDELQTALQNIFGNRKFVNEARQIIEQYQKGVLLVKTGEKEIEEQRKKETDRFQADLDKRNAEDLGFNVNRSADPIQEEKKRLEALEDVRHKARVKEIDDEAQKLGDIKLIQDAADEESRRHFLELQKIKEDARRKEVVEALQATEQVTQGVSEQLSIRNDFQNKAADDQISATQYLIQKETTLAAAGRQNDLAEQEAALAKEEQAKRDSLKKQQQDAQVLKLAELLLTDVTQKINGGKDYGTAILESVAETFGAKAIAATIAGAFFDGTERVDRDLNKSFNTGKDDYLVRVHGTERVLTGEQNALIGSLSNEQLANVAYNYRMGRYLPDFVIQPNARRSSGENMTHSIQLIRELQENNKYLRVIAQNTKTKQPSQPKELPKTPSLDVPWIITTNKLNRRK